MRELNMQYDEPLQRDQEQQQQQHLHQQQQQQLEPQQQQLQQQQHNLQHEYYEPPQQVQQQQQPEQTLNTSDGYAPQMYYDPNAAAAVGQQQQQPQQHMYDPLQQQQLQPTMGYGHIEPASEAYGEQQSATAPTAPGAAATTTAATTTGYDYWPSNMQQPYGDEVSAPKCTSVTATILATTKISFLMAIIFGWFVFFILPFLSIYICILNVFALMFD